jgi:hypothetical protein
MSVRCLCRALVPALTMLWLLSACGGGGEGGQGSGAQSPLPETAELVNTPAFGAREAFVETLPADTDGDGLPDALDPAPAQPLQFTAVDAPVLAITAVYAPREQGGWDNIAIAGAPLALETTGTSFYGGPWFLLWHHAQGVHAQPVQPDSHGRIQTQVPEMLSASVTLVAGDYRSSPQRLRSVAANAPLIRVPASALYAGDTVTLSGEHLQRITRLSLGSQRLPFSLLGDGLLSLTLPALPAGDVLHWQDDQGNRYSAALPMLRAATVTLDVSLGEGWQGAVGDVLLSAGAAQTVWVPAGMPQTVVMVHRDRPVAVQGLIWPDQPGVVLGAHSTVQHWLWRQPRLSSSAGPQWPSVRARLDAVASSAPALHDDLTQALLGDSAALLRVQQGFSEVADAAVASPAPATAGLVQARSSWAQDMLDAIMAGGSLYEPTIDVINHRALPGRASYQNVTVGVINNLLVCGGFEHITRPAGLWPSDICLENDAAFVASARVVDARSGEVLSRHIKDALDPGLIGGAGFGMLNIASVAYLVDSGGVPLCHMKPCNVEVLLGALGLGTRSALTAEEERLANSLLGRTLIERVVLELITELSGVAVPPTASTCITRNLIGSQGGQVPGFMLMVVDFHNKVHAAGSVTEVQNIFRETVLKYVLDVLRGAATDFRIERCLSSLTGEARTLFASNVSHALGEVAETAAVPLRVASVLNRVYQGWEVAIMPRKVVFNVVPRAALTSVSTPLPDNAIDANLPANALRLYGNTIAREGDDAFFPTLVITDGRNTVRMPLSAAHKGVPQDWPWYELRVPFTELVPLMQPLRSGSVTVSLEVPGSQFSDFPGSRLPIPGLKATWRSTARLIGFESSMVRGGASATVVGENLDSYQRADLRVELVPETGGAPVLALQPVFRDRHRLAFQLPLLMQAGHYRVRISSPAHEALVSDTTLQVLLADSSVLTLVDDGENQDDRVIISLLDDQYNFVQMFGSNAAAGIPTPRGGYAVELWWSENMLSSPATRLDVLCLEPGADNVCTYRIKGEVYRDGRFITFDERGKLEDEGSVAYPLF